MVTKTNSKAVKQATVKSAVIPTKKYSSRDKVVDTLMHESAGVYTAVSNSPYLIKAIQKGLPVSELESLQESLGIPMEQLLSLLSISKSTFQRRRKTDGRLDSDQSDHVIRYARLMRQAIEVFESEDDAREWLTEPQFGLGGVVPLKYAETEIGAREVEYLLGCIDHGVYA